MVVRRKLHDHNETDFLKLKILRRKIFEDGKPTGTAWSILGDDRGESVVETESNITALETGFTIQEFTDFCTVLGAWHKTAKVFGGRECVMAFPIPNMSHKLYFAPGADEPIAYPLDKIDPHYRVPRTQFESMMPESLHSAPCTLLTDGIRWSNALGHPVGESFLWGSGEVLWDRSNLIWFFNSRLQDYQFQKLWNYSLAIHNLGMGRSALPGLEIDRLDAAFLMAVQKARNKRNYRV